MAISVKEATLLSIILEGILYGFSTFLFGITLWSLTYRRTCAEVSRPMLTAACLLFLLGTMHIIVDADHAWQGFISSGGSDAFFNDVSKNTFKNALYEIETLVADAILIYRCYVVWQRFEVIIIPVIGWMSIVVTATYTVWSISRLSPTNSDVVFAQESRKWVVSFYSTALATNSITTGILAFKLWSVQQISSRMISVTTSSVLPVLLIIMECGVLYSLSLIVMLATYLSTSNSAYIVIDMIGQIIPIAFCLIIVRTAMLRSSDGTVQHSSAPDRLPIARNMGGQTNKVRMLDIEVGRMSRVSPFHSTSNVHHFAELKDSDDTIQSDL